LSRPPAASAAAWKRRTSSRFFAAKAMWMGPGAGPKEPNHSCPSPGRPIMAQPSASFVIAMFKGASACTRKALVLAKSVTL
jgi:hypothetical protein